MKRLALLSLLGMFSAAAYAQIPENFNTSCATASFPAGGWQFYNPPATPESGLNGRWICAPAHGRPATIGGVPTPGMQCSGVYSSAYHLDTSYFVSPLLDFSTAAYPGGKVYLRFDAKKDNIILGGRLGLTKADTLFSTPGAIDTIGDNLVNPLFGDADSVNWVTHEVNLSSHIGTGPFYFAFRYTSTTTTGTAWYIDNVSITTNALAVPDVISAGRQSLPVTVVGGSSASRVELSYVLSDAGTYHITLYDMMGRVVYDRETEARKGTASYIIDGISLRPGMYCVKMGNEHTYGTTKLLIQ